MATPLERAQASIQLDQLLAQGVETNESTVHIYEMLTDEQREEAKLRHAGNLKAQAALADLDKIAARTRGTIEATRVRGEQARANAAASAEIKERKLSIDEWDKTARKAIRLGDATALEEAATELAGISKAGAGRAKSLRLDFAARQPKVIRPIAKNYQGPVPEGSQIMLRPRTSMRLIPNEPRPKMGGLTKAGLYGAGALGLIGTIAALSGKDKDAPPTALLMQLMQQQAQGAQDGGRDTSKTLIDVNRLLNVIKTISQFSNVSQPQSASNLI